MIYFIAIEVTVAGQKWLDSEGRGILDLMVDAVLAHVEMEHRMLNEFDSLEL